MYADRMIAGCGYEGASSRGVDGSVTHVVTSECPGKYACYEGHGRTRVLMHGMMATS